MERIDERAVPWEKGEEASIGGGFEGSSEETELAGSLQARAGSSESGCSCKSCVLTGAAFLDGETAHAEKGTGGKRPIARGRAEGTHC